MKVFVARQPVFTAEKKIFGYELLFRQGFENSFPDIDGSAATSSVLANTFFSFELNDILTGKPGLINFTRDLLVKRTPMLFPREHIIIEVLEDVEPDDEVLRALRDFKQNGFRIALDDFVYDKKYNAMIELSSIIKFDLTATPLDTLTPALFSMPVRTPVTLLAEKVETHEEFEQARQMGFELFQGYFFSKPEILSRKDVSSAQIIKLKLANAAAMPDMDLNEVAELIKKDVSVSFKLLKFMNAAYFKRLTPIDTIKDAITYLGADELKKFINVVVISDLNPAKPNELIRSSVIRARMLEQCGSMITTRFSPDELFTIGLFASMDAIMDMPMTDILDTISLSDRIKDALLGRSQSVRNLERLLTHFERGMWDNPLMRLTEDTGLFGKLPEFHLDAMKMANSLFSKF